MLSLNWFKKLSGVFSCGNWNSRSSIISSTLVVINSSFKGVKSFKVLHIDIYNPSQSCVWFRRSCLRAEKIKRLIHTSEKVTRSEFLREHFLTFKFASTDLLSIFIWWERKFHAWFSRFSVSLLISGCVMVTYKLLLFLSSLVVYLTVWSRAFSGGRRIEHPINSSWWFQTFFRY